MRKWSFLFVVATLAACGTDDAPQDDSDAASACGKDQRCADDFGVPPNANAGGDVGANNIANNSTPDMAVVEPDMGGDDDDMGTTPDTGMPSCDRTPAPANRARKVVVAHPFTDTEYEVFDLDEQGNLTRPDVSFSMGAGHEGTIRFTPDGEVGYVVQDGGTLGVFRFNDGGQPEVLAAQHDPGFYVSGALVDAAGDNLYAWETGFRKTDDGMHNGAMYRIPLDCNSGMPLEPVEFFRGKLIRGAEWLTTSRMGVAAVDLIDDETPMDAHLVDIKGPSRVASALGFDYDDAITAGFDITANGSHMLVGDNSVFAAQPNQVAVMTVDGDSLSLAQNIDIPDPVEIVASPFDNAAIVLSTTDDSIQVLSYDPAAAEPFTLEGPLATTDATLLPLGVAMIERGDLEGLVIVGENVAVRRVQFETDGSVTDLGILSLGNGIEQITGAIGVQP